ncbi:hypothetical protein RJ640_014360 [Escallonia rubra]|uniref:Uncharacterized protein n=1 Tax=Escallonia rubra TaxID=112253 RepID=A0AA88UEK6_9ASTE|nr:hypothetical protein RJ640_014360 [Escallonia rubra]
MDIVLSIDVVSRSISEPSKMFGTSSLSTKSDREEVAKSQDFTENLLQLRGEFIKKSTAVTSSGFGAAVFSGYIVYDTERLIKTFPEDEYVWASISLYVNILNLFLEN